MKIIFTNYEEEDVLEIEVGTVIVTVSDNVFLVVEVKNDFKVFDLEANKLYCYSTQDLFEKDYEIDDIYQRDEIKIYLNR